MFNGLRWRKEDRAVPRMRREGRSEGHMARSLPMTRPTMARALYRCLGSEASSGTFALIRQNRASQRHSTQHDTPITQPFLRLSHSSGHEGARTTYLQTPISSHRRHGGQSTAASNPVRISQTLTASSSSTAPTSPARTWSRRLSSPSTASAPRSPSA